MGGAAIRVFVAGRDEFRAEDYELVHTLAWHEPDACYRDSPSTKAEVNAPSRADTGCCSLNNETDGAIANVGLACTPWGPPMPRAMRREVLS